MKRLNSQRGFTIVELMIATAVLSLVLLLATVVMISIGSLYKKGVNQSTVQGSARTIIDSVAQDIQLSNGAVTKIGDDTQGTVNVLCVNSTRYTYIKGVQIGTDFNSKHYIHVLWRDTSPSCTPVDLTDNNPNNPPTDTGVELIPEHARLSNFDVPTSAPFNITVRVAYGDDDLLNNPNETDAACKGQEGDQFCATSELATTVIPRLSKKGVQ